MKRFVTSSVVAVAVLFGSVSLSAKDLNHSMMLQNSVKKEAQIQNKKFDKRSNEIMVALHNTFKALNALQFNKDKEAIKLLKDADKEFDKVLKKDPNLKLVPIENSIELFAFEGDTKDVKVAIDSAIKLLKVHKTQGARDILIPLKDEMDITTLYIPMNTYPQVIKSAIKDLEKNNKKSAMAGLIAGFNTLVGEQVVIPLPLLMSQDLITMASKLDKSKKQEAQKLLQSASDELQKGELLGYFDKNSKVYKELQSSIKNIEKEIKGKNKVEKMYEGLKSKIKSFMDKFRGDKHKVVRASQNKAEQAVQKYQKEQMQKAIKEASKFNSEVKKDLKDTVK